MEKHDEKAELERQPFSSETENNPPADPEIIRLRHELHRHPELSMQEVHTREMLMKVLQMEVNLAGSILRPLRPNEKALSPGMRYRHYAPEGTIVLIEGKDTDVLKAMRSLYQKDTQDGFRTCVLCFSERNVCIRI